MTSIILDQFAKKTGMYNRRILFTSVYNSGKGVKCQRKRTAQTGDVKNNPLNKPERNFNSPKSTRLLSGDAMDSFFVSEADCSEHGILQEKPIQLQKNVDANNEADYHVKQRTIHEPQINCCGIQMLSRDLRSQIFRPSDEKVNDLVLRKIQDHLSSHGLFGRPTATVPQVNFELPKLVGDSIADHFQSIAVKQCDTYKQKLLQLIEYDIPEKPSVWSFTPGWTRYDEGNNPISVDFPDEDAYVFDVEVCVLEGHRPTLATAVSNSYWYSWCSNQLIDGKARGTVLHDLRSRYTMNELIPLESRISQDRVTLKEQKERVVVGHNVSYDRCRVKEQYFLEGTKLRFVDTMSLHIAVSGITSYQRNILQAGKAGTASEKRDKLKNRFDEVLEWQNVSSFNGLRDVYKLYCGGLTLDKAGRDYFVTGSLSEIREHFQDLVTYCAKDTEATFRVLRALLPDFFQRFPHPVTFAGMLEMGTAFLPVNQNWERYLRDAEDTYNDLENELTQSLKREADSACQLIENDEFRNDPWLWDLDWSVQSLKIKKAVKGYKLKQHDSEILTTDIDEDDNCITELERKFQTLMDTKHHLYKRNAFMPGYPAWYRSLCNKEKDGLLGPTDINTTLQIVPKLLKLVWDGYPLFFNRHLGWGYLVPGRPLEYCKCSPEGGTFPLKRALEMFPPETSRIEEISEGIVTIEESMNKLQAMTSETADPVGLAVLWQAVHASKETNNEKQEQKNNLTHLTPDKPVWHKGIGPYDVGIPGCWFFRLPHKHGIENNVGNPLAKDYLNKIEDGTLRATSSSVAERVLKISRIISYWRNARDRILSQMVVWLQRSQLPRYVVQAESFGPTNHYGAILPQVITSGTLTRRAVESTWMTASNAYKDRLGSELKALIQCPPEFSLVGADVDSQELWIASVIGDAYFAGQHGCTAFGWMTLQGKKTDGTDMHSRTASAVSISRDQAKVLNYGRIYGAGERFAKTLLMQFNHRLSEEEASEKARQMYSITKGIPVMKLNNRGRQLCRALQIQTDDLLTSDELSAMRKKARKIPELAHLSKLSNDELIERRMWKGGTESHMFNKLEEIAHCNHPETPVLHARISRALEPRNVGREFMTSRVNWVVQSSAVDYLHLMLVAMRYLFEVYKIDGRFCISIHDEVRYLVKSQHKFRAALALQIANLWTRCMFAYQLGMDDLPQSVAFFSSVDIDTVLRKEVDMDCQTPSNPYGLRQGYGINFGESFDIYQILEKTKGSLLD